MIQVIPKRRSTYQHYACMNIIYIMSNTYELYDIRIMFILNNICNVNNGFNNYSAVAPLYTSHITVHELILSRYHSQIALPVPVTQYI